MLELSLSLEEKKESLKKTGEVCAIFIKQRSRDAESTSSSSFIYSYQLSTTGDDDLLCRLA